MSAAQPATVADGVGVDGAHGMDGGTDPPGVGGAERGDALDPRTDAAVTEPALRDPWLGVPGVGETAVQVERVEQGDADPGFGGGGHQRLAHLVRVGVRRAVRLVVEVVELADARHAGQRHLGERGSRQPVVAVRLQAFGGPIHQLAPRPERAPVGLRARAQGAMERVAVRVGEAGDREAGEPGRAGGVGSAPTVIELNRPSTTSIATDRCAASVDQRELAPEVSRRCPRHEPTRSTNAVIRSTNASRW